MLEGAESLVHPSQRITVVELANHACKGCRNVEPIPADTGALRSQHEGLEESIRSLLERRSGVENDWRVCRAVLLYLRLVSRRLPVAFPERLSPS